MKRKKKEKHREERVIASLPLAMAGAVGITRDVSASGVFFETDAAYDVGSPIRFVLNLDTPWGKVIFKCQGKIVRLEPHNQKVGVAVQFTESTLDLGSG